MKTWILALLLCLLEAVSYAHDEGHGPKLTDPPKHGGVVSPVVASKDASLGAKASVVYKAELVRGETGTVRVYLYDKEMKPLTLTVFDPKASAVLETEKKHKVSKVPFDLSLSKDHFMGQAPKPSVKPFNIDVTLREGEKSYLVAFDNLD